LELTGVFGSAETLTAGVDDVGTDSNIGEARISQGASDGTGHSTRPVLHDVTLGDLNLHVDLVEVGRDVRPLVTRVDKALSVKPIEGTIYPPDVENT
jgi:hypothetical protein